MQTIAIYFLLTTCSYIPEDVLIIMIRFLQENKKFPGRYTSTSSLEGIREKKNVHDMPSGP